MLTAIGVNVVAGQPLDQAVLLDAGKFFLWGLMSGFAMTGLLPFIETLFGVLTEISLSASLRWRVHKNIRRELFRGVAE